MNAGLPGTGLGGVFYIFGAVLMPLHRAIRGGGHTGRSWARVAAQSGIALGIIAALFATGWTLGLVLTPDPAAMAGGGASLLGPGAVIFRWVAILGTIGLLTLLLVVVEVAGLALARRRRRSHRPTPPARRPRVRDLRRRRDAPHDDDLPRVA